MVDFKKRLGAKQIQKPVDPIALYETLDRASDKGPLRPAQLAILKTWHEQRRNEKDIILKLHTGQGKTLIGLLMLQSKLNELSEPTVYLCPNNFLIEQTCHQAKQFGIRYCTTDGALPDEFLNGKTLLITSVQKMFNGRTKFQLGQQAMPVSNILMDDAHACIDAIRDAFSIRIESESSAYQRIFQLFTQALTDQGAGTFADLKIGNPDCLLPIPYWDWQEKHSEVIKILSDTVNTESEKKTNKANIWFVWPLLKDMIQQCQCVVSGHALEIAPYLPPLDVFGSFCKAKHRVYMSATVTNDAFLVKGLRLSVETIMNPLTYKEERWSGEKMILIPSLIHESLDRSSVVNDFGRVRTGRDHGVVVLSPSFRMTADWEKCGAEIAKKDSIALRIEQLRQSQFDHPIVIVNRYDGIDLPDSMCRVLVFDSMPFSENLIDRYEEDCRATSEITAIRSARTIEQGLGRSVRGEKDYCTIILIGSELVKFVRNQASRKHLSSQTRVQVEIGLEIADMAEQEIKKGGAPLEALHNLVNQCLSRDEGWKEDDRSHVLIYQVLGISKDEGKLIDVYQNKGRFLYKYAGSFLEEAAKLCFKARFPDSGSVRVPNTHGKKPKLFGVDCLVGSDALEIKWRDATTDGDHITKEHTRMQAVRDAGYKPVRVMFYYPNRDQAIRIQKTLESLYKSVQGEYHYADAAWSYVKRRTGVDLLGILKDLAAERTAQHGQ